MDIEVCSIKMLKYKIQNNEINFDNKIYAIINTSYPETANYLDECGFEDVLVLNYDDVKDFSGNSFTENIAEDIKSFVDRMNKNSILYVCCDEGVSRSSAVACAIKRYLGQDEMTIWNDPHYNPNIFVYSILCNVMGFNDTEERLNELQQTSKNSLSNAIKNSRN